MLMLLAGMHAVYVAPCTLSVHEHVPSNNRACHMLRRPAFQRCFTSCSCAGSLLAFVAEVAVGNRRNNVLVMPGFAYGVCCVQDACHLHECT